MLDQAITILRNVFGYQSFRPFQQEIISSVLEKKDALVIMATGGGKSLCYQIPAQIFEGLTIVVSPLISLMKDQVEQLRELGVSALFLNSSLSQEEYFSNVARIKRNEVKLLYLAPETLLLQKTIDILSSVRVDAMAIDEAHCISEWGHDFRPEYRKIAEIRKLFPDSVCIALTATATPKVILDIRKNLGIDSPKTFIASFNRKNLLLQVEDKDKPLKQTIEFIKKFPGKSGIIYCLSRKQVDSLTEDLVRNGFSAKPYHAGLSDFGRHRNQDSFIKDDIQIIVATVAFGMGINKPNIRFILHYDLPQNIESYYQQIGRAGRDGLNAQCLLLFSYGDIHKLKFFINQKQGDEQKAATLNLKAMVSYAGSFECRRIPLLKYFGEKTDIKNCGMCDNCLSRDSASVDLTIPAQKFLSCVKRTGERFGAEHIIDVLRGSESKKVIESGHNTLSTYNIGKEYSKKQWLNISRQLLQKDLMEQDLEFGTLRLTEKAWDVFKGKEYVFGRKPDASEDELIKAKDEIENAIKIIQSKIQGEDQDYDQKLFELLRIKRKELADKNGIPPYAIFPDKTLIEMSVFYPESSDDMLKLHGVGLKKFEKYGADFIDEISSYCKSNNVKKKTDSRPGNRSCVRKETKKSPKKTKGFLFATEYNAGKILKELMIDHDTTISLIVNNLTKYAREGHFLRYSDEFLEFTKLTSDQINLVLRTIEEVGHEALKPIYDALNQEIDYDDLHLIRLYYFVKGNKAFTRA
ncbi:DNA helicase RecQ [Desulforegula conservatrix]|uniref:DNA helicase RecQ n=1 Tax=Desulforegula conservatrix TaxID=153026 RepID=UPI0004281F5C|nr:DNA helicase RecQ [Desulforegula conservatrix]